MQLPVYKLIHNFQQHWIGVKRRNLGKLLAFAVFVILKHVENQFMQNLEVLLWPVGLTM
jgi:hypothetical protein